MLGFINKKINKMKIKQYNRIILLILIILISIPTYSQDIKYFRAKKNREVVLTPQNNGSIVMLRISGIFDKAKKVIYKDEENGYEVKVPEWLYIMETNSLNAFGGTLPAIDSIENAIMINSYDKSDYSDFADFRFYIIEDTAYIKGTTPKYSENHIFNSITKAQFDDFEYSYKVSVDYLGKTYLMEYILLETDKSFLWIMFTATDETFEKNKAKFSEFLTAIELL